MQQILARQWVLHDFGKAEAGLELQAVSVTAPLPHEVQIRTAAVSLNYRDLLMLENGMGSPLSFPFVPGSDMAGIVEAVGSAVVAFHPGDRVIASFSPDWIDGVPEGSARNPPYKALGGFYPGVLSEIVTLPQSWLVRAPVSLSLAEASTLPCAGLTAWFALQEKARIAPGQSVLVQGTGGVALFGVAIARAYGAEVFVVSGDAGKRDRARALGVHHSLAREAWVEEVYALTQDRGVDHILELVGGPHLGRSLEAVAVGGRISVIGVLDGFTLSASAGPLLSKSATLQGISVGHRRALENFVAAIDEKGIKPVVDAVYPFEEVAQAVAHLRRGPFGKVVVTL